MEVVQGKSTDKKIIIAQEIAFAKVLAGNNKTLRDRAVKKLKKWLSVRGNGKWAFTEDEFIRIWTGLFYCMWMSDKFLVQEELAENISNLIHCFRKNSDNAILFIKCFYKRILMEWAGLDQYRIDKFQMLARRFLRQAFKYCKEKDWDKLILKKLNGVFDNVVLHRDSALGFVLHFISIYAEELAKVGNGKLKNETVLILIEPFVRVICRNKDERVLKEAEDFFNYLMRQTDVGIESEEQFLAWKQRGFPGAGPHALKKVEIDNGNDNDECENSSDEEIPEGEQKPWDPRAGSVHVLLPQIPIDVDGILNLFKKYKQDRQTNTKGRKRLRCLSEKFAVLKKGKFPEKIKKDPILLENTKKRKQTKKNAKSLLEFREELEKGPIKTKEFSQMYKELESQEDSETEDSDAVSGLNESEMDEISAEEEEFEEKLEEKKPEKIEVIKAKKLQNENNKKKTSPPKKVENNKKIVNEVKNGVHEVFAESEEDGREKENQVKTKNKKKSSPGKKVEKKKKIVNGVHEVLAESEDGREKGNQINTKNKKNTSPPKKVEKNKKIVNGAQNGVHEVLAESEEDGGEKENQVKTKNKNKKLRKKIKKINGLNGNFEEHEVKPKTKRKSLIGLTENAGAVAVAEKLTPIKKAGVKRKFSDSWQVEELDASSPEYYKIETPKVIKIERKIEDSLDFEENVESSKTVDKEDEKELKKEKAKHIVPAFWDKAIAKASNKKHKKSKDLLSPFSDIIGENKSASERKISFALDKNMAQENEEYLEEVKNSPRVPFDGSRKPVQSALKSGLSPSPINPFYRYKRIKF